MSLIRGPIGSGPQRVATSSPVQTTATPGARRAASVSMAVTFAWACGLRTKITCSRPGSIMSSTYVAVPVMSRGSSRRFMRAPSAREIAIVHLAETKTAGLGVVPKDKEQEILTLRRQLRLGPRRLGPLVGLHHSTVSVVLQRHGLSRLRDSDRTTGIPIRYVRDHPGELIHVDMKPLARVPEGGGHRVHGRTSLTKHRGGGYEVVHVAVDDASRLAFVQVLPDRRGRTAARFLVDAAAFFAEQGVRVERVMTDRAYSYIASRAFRETIASLQVRHKVIRPYRPQTNGKAERFIQTLLAEWAYAKLYRSNQERRRALPKWLHHYNYHRPHTALRGQPPVATVNNVCKHYN